jgi:hypothetical protein
LVLKTFWAKWIFAKSNLKALYWDNKI